MSHSNAFLASKGRLGLAKCVVIDRCRTGGLPNGSRSRSAQPDGGPTASVKKVKPGCKNGPAGRTAARSRHRNGVNARSSHCAQDRGGRDHRRRSHQLNDLVMTTAIWESLVAETQFATELPLTGLRRLRSVFPTRNCSHGGRQRLQLRGRVEAV